MTKKTANMNIGCFFTILNRRCEVITTDSFGGVIHYGFRTVDTYNGIIGWVPADLIGQCEFTK